MNFSYNATTSKEFDQIIADLIENLKEIGFGVLGILDFKEIFEKKGIPFQIASRQTVFDPAGLPELISFLKIIEGNGGFFDHDKILKIALPGLGKKALDQFKNWCFQNRFSLQQGLIKVNRFPIPGMAAAKRCMSARSPLVSKKTSGL